MKIVDKYEEILQWVQANQNWIVEDYKKKRQLVFFPIFNCSVSVSTFSVYPQIPVVNVEKYRIYYCEIVRVLIFTHFNSVRSSPMALKCLLTS